MALVTRLPQRLPCAPSPCQLPAQLCGNAPPTKHLLFCPQACREQASSFPTSCHRALVKKLSEAEPPWPCSVWTAVRRGRKGPEATQTRFGRGLALANPPCGLSALSSRPLCLKQGSRLSEHPAGGRLGWWDARGRSGPEPAESRACARKGTGFQIRFHSWGSRWHLTHSEAHSQASC